LIPNVGGGLFDIENHTLFSIGLEGRVAISNRLLFHKRSRVYFAAKPETSMLHALAPRNEVINTYKTYRKRISGSKLSRSRKTALQILAVENLARTMLGTVVEGALRKSSHVPFIWRLYCFIEKRLGGIHVFDDSRGPGSV